MQISDTIPNIFVPQPARPAPPETTGALGWVRANLFNGWFNSLLTLAALWLLFITVPPLLSWILLKATWTRMPGGCPPEHNGACWAFIIDKFRVLMTGLYPEKLLFRPVLAGTAFAVLCALTIYRKLKTTRLIVLWFILPIAVFWFINGGAGLKTVDQSLWGGLMLSLGLSIVGILFSLPIGILLALGRRSELSSLRSLCTGIIESIRGIPLITILFMASVMLPIFLPEGVNINNLLRVQIGIILFSSAYMAEVVRGGLQAVPPGQIEAAEALGLSRFQINLYITLPQALRHVVPSLIGRCVALFKDTSLVIIVGLLDFLGMIKASAQDPEWLGHDAEAYVFCAFIYWLICFTISRYGKSIEKNSNWS